MSHHKPVSVAVVQQIQEVKIEPGFLKRSWEFCNRADVKSYMGRTVFVIAVLALTYYVYKNRRAILQTCIKTHERAKSLIGFKNNQKTHLLVPPNTPMNKNSRSLSLELNSPINLNVTLRNILPESNEGKEGLSKAEMPEPAISTKVETPKASPSITTTTT